MPTSIQEHAGRRIRRLRRQSGLGVRELAREIGISPSSLSALEANTAGVSLKRMQQVAAHFDLHLSDILAEDRPQLADPPGVEVFPNCAANTPSVERQPGVYYQHIGTGRGHVIQPYLLSFNPSASYELDPTSHVGEEFNYVVFGELALLFGEEAHSLRQGDLVRFSSEIPHAFRNPSPHGCALLLGGMTPPW